MDCCYGFLQEIAEENDELVMQESVSDGYGSESSVSTPASSLPFHSEQYIYIYIFITGPSIVSYTYYPVLYIENGIVTRGDLFKSQIYER